MTEVLRPVARVRLFQQVVEHLLSYIRTHDLRPGDQLPTERALAESLAVSRATVKQAVIVLELAGVLEVRHGGGIFLRYADIDVSSLAEIEARRRRLPDVLEARELLEVHLARAAAVRRTDRDLTAFDAALAAMEAEITHGELGEQGDRMFHAALANAAHNEVLAAMMGAIESVIAESRRESLRQPGRPSVSLGQHREIADAVRDGDADRAGRAMEQHLRTVATVRLLDWLPDADGT